MAAAPADAAAGMERYVTPGESCQGRAKSFPEDFRVEEAVSLGKVSKEGGPGLYPLYRVEKRGIDTMHMASELSRALRSRVSYGGLKDSRAVAVQHVTPTSLRSERPERVVGSRFNAELVGYVPRPLTRASIVGNRFEVVLRGCCGGIGLRVAEAYEYASRRELPNYYGLQRFGSLGRGTHLVGGAIVRGDFKGAVAVILAGTAPGEAPAKGKDVEKLVARSLEKSPDDWPRALRAVPLRLRRLYVQAFQSFIFNRALSRALGAGEDIGRYAPGDNWATVDPGGLRTSRAHSTKETPTGDATPLIQIPGYAFRDYGSRFDRFVLESLEEQGVSSSQFYVKEMQEVSAEGGFRRPHLAVADPSSSIEGDSAALRFTLASGQYATVLLREIMKPEDPSEAGLA